MAVGAALLVCATGAAACGSGELDIDQRTAIGKYNVAFSLLALNGQDYERATAGVDYLIALCREDPKATYTVGDETQTVREVTEDAANTLRGVDAELAAKLDRVLDGSCED